MECKETKLSSLQRYDQRDYYPQKIGKTIMVAVNESSDK